MTTAHDIIDSALRNINMPVEIARNDQEMLRMLNQALDDMQRDFENTTQANDLVTGEK
jgi:hypothetical protein